MVKPDRYHPLLLSKGDTTTVPLASAAAGAIIVSLAEERERRVASSIPAK